MEQVLPLLTNLAVGAVGGNVAGTALKDKSLGFIGNTLAGLVGGGLAGQVLTGVLANLGATGTVGSIASSGVGGIIGMVVVAYLKPYLTKVGVDVPQMPSQSSQQ